MRASIQITLEDGTRLQGHAELQRQPVQNGDPSSSKGQPGGATLNRTSPDFSLPLRPFMKRYASGLSGAKKITLLVAYMAKGNVSTPVFRSDVEKAWRKISGILGPYNGAHDTRARDNGWIHSPKYGSFELLPGWEAILQ